MRARTLDALVTDTHVRWALAGLRGLGRAGIRAMALAPTRAGAGLWSRYAAARERSPDPVRHPEEFAAAVARAAERFGPLVVYPGHEESIDALFAADLPASARLPYSGASATQALRDKRELARLAENAGLTTPRTLFEGTAGELASKPVAGPCAVKAARPAGALELTHLVDDGAQLRAVLAGLPEDEPVLAQERADGQLSALALVVDRDGRQVARFQQRSVRTWPARAGVSTVALSVPVDEGLAERCAALLSESGYWGLAQLQFLPTERGPTLIDVNTRFYGSMALALAAGVNLPHAWHSVATETAASQAPASYRLGVRYRWLEGDLISALRGSPGHLLERGPRPRVGSSWAADDPLPGALIAFGAASSRLRARMGAKSR